MRVVAGSARGRRLSAPDGQATRPTTDRVREATFNALTSLDAVEGAVVLDLFAGSGAMGIEALSRGAASVTFVESDRRVAAVIRANLEATGLSSTAATVVTSTVERHLVGASGSVDLVVADPPYAYDAWDDLLAAVATWADVLVVAESDREIDPGEGWDVLRARRYGSTVVTIMRRQANS